MNYVITIQDIPQSVRYAERCIQSAAQNGLTVEKFNAVTPRNTDLRNVLFDEGISVDGFRERYSRLDNCVAAFLSHYSIWKLAAESNTPTTIFEHDAIVTDRIDNVQFDKVITVGKPSYGRYNTPTFIGTGPLTQKRYFGGAHAYRVNKQGARALIGQARLFARPTDVFLHLDTFPWLQEVYPWKAEVKESFSTIQNEQGCLAKHGYGEGYALL